MNNLNLLEIINFCNNVLMEYYKTKVSNYNGEKYAQNIDLTDLRIMVLSKAKIDIEKSIIIFAETDSMKPAIYFTNEEITNLYELYKDKGIINEELENILSSLFKKACAKVLESSFDLIESNLKRTISNLEVNIEGLKDKINVFAKKLNNIKELRDKYG